MMPKLTRARSLRKFLSFSAVFTFAAVTPSVWAAGQASPAGSGETIPVVVFVLAGVGFAAIGLGVGADSRDAPSSRLGICIARFGFCTMFAALMIAIFGS
ncbi:MAG: hypothetical protein SFV17_10345 [Candidatus Obscuribacter sp.]|nr:hypothetical protein [Candidatus Obscuribacter sp.]